MKTKYLDEVNDFMGKLDARLSGIGPDGTAAFAAACALGIPLEQGCPDFVHQCRELPLTILTAMENGRVVRSEVGRAVETLGLDPANPNFGDLPPEADLDPAAASIFAALSYYQLNRGYAIHAAWLAFDSATSKDAARGPLAISGAGDAAETLISNLGKLLAILEAGTSRPEKAAQALLRTLHFGAP